MDNMANVQINIYMLACMTSCFLFFIRKKYMWSGLLLGLTISLKIYTVFFLFYFLYKREFRVVLWTFLFVSICNAIPFLVFGIDQTIDYYREWVTNVAPRSYMANHKNQSLFGAFLRFFTSEDPTHNLYVNLLNIDPYRIKKITYLFVVVASLFPFYLFREKLTRPNSLKSILEYTFIFTSIPILSPVSWKAYFIFLWIPYFVLYMLLFKTKNNLNKRMLLFMKCLFWITVILNVASTELIVGPYFSDVMEAYSAITFGTIILLLMQLVIYMRINQFDLNAVVFRSTISEELRD